MRDLPLMICMISILCQTFNAHNVRMVVIMCIKIYFCRVFASKIIQNNSHDMFKVLNVVVCVHWRYRFSSSSEFDPQVALYSAPLCVSFLWVLQLPPTVQSHSGEFGHTNYP